MLSKSSKHAIKGVLYLALHADLDNKIQAKDLSGPINVPAPYIAKLLQELARHGIVASLRGPNGGFYLTETNRKVNIMRIVEIIDGDNKFSTCLLSLDECNAENPCPLHHSVGDSMSKMTANLRRMTIEDLVADIKQGKSVLPL